MLFRVGPLCIGLISAWFNHTGSKHSLTFPLALGTSRKLLHHSDVSSTPSGAVMCCFCSLSNSSKGFWSAYAMHLGGTWYGLLSGFICIENVPLQHPLLLNTSSNSLCNYCVVSVLLFLLLSYIGPERKYLVSDNVLLSISLILLFDFEMPSVFVQHFSALTVCCFGSSPCIVCMSVQQLSLPLVCSAPIAWMFIFSILSTSMSGMHSKACPLLETKKLHFLLLFLCSNTTICVPNWVIVVLLFIFNCKLFFIATNCPFGYLGNNFWLI